MLPRLTEAREHAISPLEAIGYAYWRGNPKVDNLFLVRGLPPSAKRRTHHIHMTEKRGELWQRLLFRDYLRLHPGESQAYERLKRTLASTYREDREAYTAGKADYIREVMGKARAELWLVALPSSLCYPSAMRVTVEIPDEFVERLLPAGRDAARSLLEEAVAGAYRDGRLTMEQVRQLLGFGTRMQMDAFLQQHEIYDYTVEDLDKDMATLDRLLATKTR